MLEDMIWVILTNMHAKCKEMQRNEEKEKAHDL